MSWKWVRYAVLALAVAAVAAGCAEERAPINRVQPNALAKSFFVGTDLQSPADDPEFWTQATIVDVGYGASQFGLFPSTFTQSVSRVKWQITEDLLLARLTYERIADSDGKGAGPASTDGQIVAAYAITKHFDIRHAYNPSTGEEQNIIEENASDRAWFDREYFRIDWSRNLNTDAYDFDTLSLIGVFGGVSYSPLAYYVNDPNDKDAPYFDTDTGYFDITNKVFATPEQIDLSHLGWGISSFPACFLPDELFGGSEPAGNCNATEVTVRQAFRRVVDTDYQPADWDGYRFQAYGGFYLERYGYARNYGMSDDKWHRFLTRYNVWERSHYYDDAADMEGPVECYTPDTLGYGEDPHADDNNDGTEDRCSQVTANLGFESGVCSDASLTQACPDADLSDDEDKSACCAKVANWIHGGSKCDTFSQKCTLPFRSRPTRPLAWYYTNESNLDYFESTEWATHDHDVALRHAVMVARYAECMETANDKDFCAYGKDPDGNLIWQPNPVYFGQMDDHLEAKQLAKEVDDCRHGLTEPADFGADSCEAIAELVAEKRSMGGDRPMDPGVIELAKMNEMIVLCHSPVEAGDPSICAPSDQRLPAGISSADCAEAEKALDLELIKVCRSARYARRGDLRYHLVNVLEKPNTPSPWGIYTDAEDPLTGETFSAGINVWSHVNDLWSQVVIDRVRYIKGELATEDITDGSYVKDWATAADAAAGGGMLPKMRKEQIERRVEDASGVPRELVENFERTNLDPDVSAQFDRLKREVADVRASIDSLGHNAVTYETRRKMALDTFTEAELVDPMMLQHAGMGGMPINDLVMENTSPLRGANPAFKKQLQNMFQVALAERGSCMLQEAPAPMAVTGLADVLEAKFQNVCASYDDEGQCTKTWGAFGTAGNKCATPGDMTTCTPVNEDDPDWQFARSEAMRNYMAQRAHYAVIVHEMGHSVGERHNFVSSSDAFSYRPQYWQLRTDDGANEEECTTYSETGEDCVGPRWYDPLNDNERDNMLWMWMHSSVMDYAGEYTQDMLGLGGYDFAAHRMFYGDSVAVFDDESYEVGQPAAQWMFFKTDSFGGLLGYRPEFEGEDIHYSQLNKNYKLIQDCQEVDTDEYRPASWDQDKQGEWDPLVDGLIVEVDGKYTKCRQQKVDYMPWSALEFPDPTEFFYPAYYINYYRGGPMVDERKDRVRVPYGFATDRWADLGNAAVYRHDNGADNYEVFDFFVSQKEVQHIFDNYRRGRQGFSVRSAANRTLGRYMEKIRDGAKGIGLIKNIYQNEAPNSGYAADAFWGYVSQNWYPEQLLASGLVFDDFAGNLTRPESGPHYFDNGVYRSALDSESFAGDEYDPDTHDVYIPDGATGYFGNVTAGGKLVENTLAENQGEFDANYTMNAGSYYEKLYVPYLMAESVDNFISDSRTDFVDGRYRSVSLADVFPDGFRRMLANNLTWDHELTGVRLAAEANGALMVDEAKYSTWPLGRITWWTDTPEVCFPAAGTTVCGAPSIDGTTFDPEMPPGTAILDPQVGWEQQKFLIAYTLLYLPSNVKQNWLDQLRIWAVGYETDPAFDNRIEFHDPLGQIFVARTFGKETIFGKEVHKGISARVLEYANELLLAGYEVDEVHNDGDAVPDWYIVKRHPNGDPIVKFDSLAGYNGVQPPTDCNAGDNSGCTCDHNRACIKLRNYVAIPTYLRQALGDFGYAPSWDKEGIYD